jgi:hypothetical protein
MGVPMAALAQADVISATKFVVVVTLSVLFPPAKLNVPVELVVPDL